MGNYNTPNSGSIYSAADGVTAIAANRITDYTGDAGATIAVESIAAYGQNFWQQARSVISMALSFVYNGVYWAPTILDTMLGTSAVTESTPEETPLAAPTRKINTSITTVPQPEFLTKYISNSDSKKHFIHAFAGEMESDLGLSLSKDEFITTTLGIGCFADSADEIVWFYDEP